MILLMGGELYRDSRIDIPAPRLLVIHSRALLLFASAFLSAHRIGSISTPRPPPKRSTIIPRYMRGSSDVPGGTRLQPQDCPREQRASQLAASDAFGKREDGANQERGVVCCFRRCFVGVEGDWGLELRNRNQGAWLGTLRTTRPLSCGSALQAASPIVTLSSIA